MKKPISIAIASASLISCILITTTFRGSPLVRGFIGDIVAVIFIYFIAKSFKDFHAIKLAISSLFFAYLIELTQYFRVIDLLRISRNSILGIILGATADVKDLFAYIIGAVAAYIIDRALSNLFKEA